MIAPTHEQNTTVTAEELEARAAVMEIPLYPDLSVALKKALGYGPHVDMMQHLVYWFHPRHPKMQKRRELYKTFEQWHEECGLANRQVKKGRKRLQEAGLLTCKRRQYGRVHYYVNWPALAAVLNLTTVGGPIDNNLSDDFDDLEDFNPTTVGGPIQSDHQGDQANPTTKATRFNPTGKAVDPIQKTTSGDYTEDFFQENSLLQSGENGLNGHPSPPPINKDLEPEEQDSPQPLEDKRHSQDGDTPSESTAATEQLSLAEQKDRNFIRRALGDPETCGLEEPLRQYRTGQIDLATLADTMRGKPYLRGSNAYSSLRPEQVAAVLDEMREEVAA